MRFYNESFNFVFENPAQYPASRPYELQQIRERSAGGTTHVETFAAPLRTRTLNFRAMSDQDYQGMLDWYLNKVNGMADEFQFQDERNDTFTVRFAEPRLDLRESRYLRYDGAVVLEIIA